MTTSYGLDGRGSVPGSGKISIQVLGSTQLPIQWVPKALSPGVMWQGREVEVNNGGAIPSLPHTLPWRGA
jgi:hypothetical protein